ncbi:MAG: stage II sporulation protein M [Acidimicrobiales bacterium]
MDLDHFLAAHQASWMRLGELTGKVSKSRTKRWRRKATEPLDAVDIDELIRLYQRTSTHLSYSRTYYRDPALNARLTVLVADAQSVIYGIHANSLKGLTHFFVASFPGAVWHLRRFMVVSAALTFLPALAFGTWLSLSDRAVNAVMSEEYRTSYLEEDFEEYYSSEPATQFTTAVFVNNMQVGFLAFGVGVAACVPTAFVLASNGANLGVAGGLFTSAGKSSKFWGLILPHGLLEMTAVVIAGAAGLALGWSIIVPGDRSRIESMAESGRRSVVLVLGLIAVFFVSGLIEGFVTGQPWPTALRVGIGIVVWAGFCAYIAIQGEAASKNGFTGTLDELDDLGLKLNAGN